MANKKNRKKTKNVSNTANVVEKRTKNHKELIALENNIVRISGAIESQQELNPPPSRNLKHPCVICNKSVNNNQQSLQCVHCDKWCHRSCDGMDVDTYKKLDDNNNNPSITNQPDWYCLYCTMKFHYEAIPFTLSDDFELDTINNSDNMEFCKSLPTLEEIYETNKFSSYPDQTEEASLPSNLSSKYHTVSELQKLKVERNFNIFHSNVNGLESKFSTLHTFLAGSTSPMDVIAITETSEHIDHGFLSNVDLEGYKLFSAATKSSKGGSALYVNNDFDSFERTDLKMQNDLVEAVWIEIKNKKSKNIVCGCIYRHPRRLAKDFDDFNKYMDSTLDKLVKEKKEIYMCGDFNIDLLKLNEIDSHMDFYTLLTSHGLLPFITQPSRVVQSQTPSLLDNIFSTNFSDAVQSGNIFLTLSEHFSQFASINRGSIDTKKITMYGRNMKNFSEDAFRDDVAIQQWRMDTNDPSTLMADLSWRLNACADRHAPTEKLKEKEVKLRLKPWITPDIQKLIKVRDRLFARKKRQPTNDHVREVYNLARNRVTREIDKSRKDHYDSYFEEHNANLKKTWEGIRNIVNVKKSTKFSISHLAINGKIVDQPLDIANSFNNFFVNVGPETEKTVPKVPNTTPEQFLKNRNQFEFVIAHISEEEIVDIIVALKPKATGHDSIPTKFLKIVADIIAVPLCRIINLSFLKGIFPETLKTSKVIALFKGGSTEELNNYRPISLLPIFDKIIEKIVHRQLYAFLEEHDVFFKNQFGFKKKTSTGHSLIEITEQIKESIDSGKFGCGIFIDLKKAFDTVNHDILLKKLEHYGVRGTMLSWFESY